MKSIGPKLLRELRHFVNEYGTDTEKMRLLPELDAIARPSAKRRAFKSATKKTKTSKRLSKNEETAGIRAALERRAGGVCECGCEATFTEFNPAEMDHQAGRGKAPQTIQNTWLLTRSCHWLKTSNYPSAAAWLKAFRDHCLRNFYPSEAKRARERLEFVQTRSALSNPNHSKANP